MKTSKNISFLGKRRRSALDPVPPPLPRHPPSLIKMKAYLTIRLIPKTMVSTGPGWVKENHQEKVKEDGREEDLYVS